MLDLANDPRTLSISTGPTFRQKGEAFYTQLNRDWMRQCFMDALRIGLPNRQILMGYYGQAQQQCEPLMGLLSNSLGGIGAGPTV